MMDDYRIGFATDIHRLVDGEGFVLGGEYIKCDKSVVAHSDGDCLYHAVSEAIFGAIAIGDLGTHFPSDDEKTLSLDSSIIVKYAYEKMKEAGYSVSNVDTSIVLESPRLSPHIQKMRENLADLLKIDISKVSIKAGTNEKIGELGRNEAVQAHAIILLQR